jgi:hypothetical protein
MSHGYSDTTVEFSVRLHNRRDGFWFHIFSWSLGVIHQNLVFHKTKITEDTVIGPSRGASRISVSPWRSIWCALNVKYSPGSVNFCSISEGGGVLLFCGLWHGLPSDGPWVLPPPPLGGNPPICKISFLRYSTIGQQDTTEVRLYRRGTLCLLMFFFSFL